MADDGKLLKLRVISPDRVFFEGDADFVELRTSEGEIGVYRAHIPLTSILVPGLLKIHLDGDVTFPEVCQSGILYGEFLVRILKTDVRAFVVPEVRDFYGAFAVCVCSADDHLPIF